MGRLLNFLRATILPFKGRTVAGQESRDAWLPYATPDRFRFEILGNAVFEAGQSLTDVLDLAGVVFSGRTPDERRAIALDALESLLADDLVELKDFDDLGDAAELRKSAREILASGDREAGGAISIYPTTAGVLLAEDPPEEIRELWRMP